MNTKSSCYIGVGSGGCNIVKSIVTISSEQCVLYDKNIDLSIIPENFENFIIICTLGGTFGSEGLITLVNKLGLDKNINVIVTTPINFEGKSRKSLAQATIEKLKSMNITLKIIDNNELLSDENANINMKNSFNNINKKIEFFIRTLK